MKWLHKFKTFISLVAVLFCTFSIVKLKQENLKKKFIKTQWQNSYSLVLVIPSSLFNIEILVIFTKLSFYENSDLKIIM